MSAFDESNMASSYWRGAKLGDLKRQEQDWRSRAAAIYVRLHPNRNIPKLSDTITTSVLIQIIKLFHGLLGVCLKCAG